MLRTEAADPKALVLYNLRVHRADGTILLRASDVLRGDFLYHHVTLEAAAELVVGSTLGSSTIELFKMSDQAGQPFLIGPNLTPIAPKFSYNFLRRYQLTAGNYGVRFAYSNTPGSTYYQSNDN